MVTINCLASGSTGNCYEVNMGSSCFLLDAGIPIETLSKKVNLNKVDFAFISHNHKDHSKSAEKLATRGVSIVYGNLIGEFEKIAKNGEFGGDFQMLGFPVEHGEEKNGGIIVFSNETKECILYATDFTVCKYDLQKWIEYYIPGAKFSHIIVECNYLEELIEDKNQIKEIRQINTHMGLKGLELFLDKLDLSNCQEIILTHLSQRYGNAIIMGSTIYSKYKIKTGVCNQWGGIDYYG